MRPTSVGDAAQGREGPGWLVGDRGALLIPERTLLDPVAVKGPLTLNGWCCRRSGDSRPRSKGRRLGSAGKIRVVIITGDGVNTHARGDRVCIIVLCGSERGCDRVIVDCSRSTVFLRTKWQVGGVVLTGG